MVLWGVVPLPGYVVLTNDQPSPNSKNYVLSCGVGYNQDGVAQCVQQSVLGQKVPAHWSMKKMCTKGKCIKH